MLSGADWGGKKDCDLEIPQAFSPHTPLPSQALVWIFRCQQREWEDTLFILELCHFHIHERERGRESCCGYPESILYILLGVIFSNLVQGYLFRAGLRTERKVTSRHKYRLDTVTKPYGCYDWWEINPECTAQIVCEALHHWLDYGSTSQTVDGINPATQFSVICVTGFYFFLWSQLFPPVLVTAISHPLAYCSPAANKGWWTSACNQPLHIFKLWHHKLREEC